MSVAAHNWTDDELLHLLEMRDGGWSARESAEWLKALRGIVTTKDAVIDALNRVDRDYRDSK